MRSLPDELNPPPRLIMGSGPLNADPRVLRAMAMPLLGQFDPAFTEYMNETMALYREVHQTSNRWTFIINGTARAGIEAILVSLLSRGDKVLVPIFGRFGHLLHEIAARCGADIHVIETDWGTVFAPEAIEAAIKRHRPAVVAVVHGDTSTTMAQPLEDLGTICRRHGALFYVDATATLGGMDLRVDDWGIDAASAGLQKCLSGPPGSAPITFNDQVAEVINRRKHIERGLVPPGFAPGPGPPILSNYLDLSMLMDYWSESRLPHHTEAISMLYASRECARILLKEGLQAAFERHRLGSRALCAGLEAMGLKVFGDQRYKMPNVTGVYIPDGIDGDAVRRDMLLDFGIEIATTFGPLRGRIWRIGTMGYTCQKPNILICLGALEATLTHHGFKPAAGEAVQAALAVYREAGQ